MSICSLRHWLAIFGAALLCTATTSALAASITVTNTADSGNGTLRDALASAANGDTIDATGVSGTILLTNGQLMVNNSITILGPGPGSLAVNGNYPDTTNRVFFITFGLNVTIAGLTITNGNAGTDWGGGIFNDASTLTVSNCAISGNAADTAAGIHNGGEGGPATLTIVNSTLSGNSADFTGGGIRNDGAFSGSATLTIVNSTFSGNSAGGHGGAIRNDGYSGGNATLIIINSTFSGNSAADEGVAGGIHNAADDGSATVTLGSTILNAGAQGANIVGGPGVTVTSVGYNLSSDDGGGFLTAIADQVNTNPQLGPLQNNGGLTFTHALLTNSPAIDKGKRDAVTNVVSNTDQRGLPRPVDLPGITNASGGDGSDIGAFEMQNANTPIPILLTGAQKLLNGSFQFSFTNTPGASFTVLASTNIALPLINWTVLGPPTEISPGHFQYTDPQATNQPQGFYRVRSP